MKIKRDLRKSKEIIWIRKKKSIPRQAAAVRSPPISPLPPVAPIPQIPSDGSGRGGQGVVDNALRYTKTKRSLIRTLAIFSVGVPSKHSYKLTKISVGMQETPYKQLKTSFCFWTLFLFLGKTLSSKVDLIWQLWPIRLRQNARTLILFLSYFHTKLVFLDQNITSYFKILISTPAFPEKHFFHLESSLTHFLENMKPFVTGST